MYVLQPNFILAYRANKCLVSDWVCLHKFLLSCGLPNDVSSFHRSVRWEYLSSSNYPRKGSQRKFDLSVDGTTIVDAAWAYQDPLQGSKLDAVKNYVAFVGIAPVMIKCREDVSNYVCYLSWQWCADKKNFRYARLDECHSDSSCTVSSTPNSSAPTTPTLGCTVPTIQFTYNPSIYDYRHIPLSLTRKASHCGATSGWKGVGLPTVSEAEGYLEVEIGNDRMLHTPYWWRSFTAVDWLSLLIWGKKNMAFVLSFVWFGWAFDYVGCSSASSTGVLVAASWVVASWLF